MYPYQLMMKPHNCFISLKDVISDLILGVVQQVAQFHGYLRPIHTNVLVALAKCSCPLPGLIKHLVVQVPNEPLVQQFPLLLPCSPAGPLQDVDLLPCVQIALGGDVNWHQACGFVRVEWRCPRRVMKLHIQHLTKVRDANLQAVL